MKTAVVLLSFAIVCSAFTSEFTRDFKLDAPLLKRQATSTCTNPTITYLNLGQNCNADSTTSVCKENLVCTTVNGRGSSCQFITPSTSCAAPTDCGGFNPCVNGKCAVPVVLPGGACGSNADCISKTCNSGKCAAGAAGDSCSDNLSCAAGLFCNYNPTTSSGVCTTRVATGGDCSAYVTTPYDSFLTCAKGQACNAIFANNQITSAVCTDVFSVSAGTAVGALGPLLCKSGLYAVSTDANGLSYTCSESASCNNDNTCLVTGKSQCACTSSGNGNGTCSSTCTSQFSNVYSCLLNSDFGLLSGAGSIYSSSAPCRSQTDAVLCCENKASTYVPSGFSCSSSDAKILAPILFLVAFLALFF